MGPMHTQSLVYAAERDVMNSYSHSPIEAWTEIITAYQIQSSEI